MVPMQTIPARPSRTLPVWAPLAAVVALALLWMVTFETGQIMSALGVSSMFMHELFHDGRHLLGVPCH